MRMICSLRTCPIWADEWLLAVMSGVLDQSLLDYTTCKETWVTHDTLADVKILVLRQQAPGCQITSAIKSGLAEEEQLWHNQADLSCRNILQVHVCPLLTLHHQAQRCCNGTSHKYMYKLWHVTDLPPLEIGFNIKRPQELQCKWRPWPRDIHLNIK